MSFQVIKHASHRPAPFLLAINMTRGVQARSKSLAEDYVINPGHFKINVQHSSLYNVGGI